MPLVLPRKRTTLPSAALITTSAIGMRQDWLRIKHDGFRMIVARDGDRVRLFTRNGHDWANRYPRIVESARKIRAKQSEQPISARLRLAAT
jgi:ATP-dependent DNA ligase